MDGGLLAGLEGSRVRRRLARRLLIDVAVSDWPTLGKALRPLAEASENGPGPFLDRAVTDLRDDPELRRVEGQSVVIAELVDAMASREAAIATRARLQPATSPRWFARLFKLNVLPFLHARDPSGKARIESLAELKRLAVGVSFPELAATVRSWYDAEPVSREMLFKQVLLPSAASHPGIVLAPTLKRAYTLSHRAVLGRHALLNIGLLEKAWPGNDAPTCLDLAIVIYSNLIGPKPESMRELARHLGSDDEVGGGAEGAMLLDQILKSTLDRLDHTGPEGEQVLFKGLVTLAEHLDACRKAGGDLSGSRPLRALNERVRAAVSKALADLPTAPQAGGVGEAERAAIRRYVDRLRLTLRLGRLAGGALGPGDRWADEARGGIRDRVFGLGAGPAGWDEATLGFRAALLRELDPLLRDCLEGGAEAAEADRFFQEVYLPLAKVPGFLKAVRRQGEADWPHLAWVRGPGVSGRLARERLQAFFATVAGVEVNLDAEDALTDLARAGITLSRPGASPWSLAPEEWYAGQRWSRNAGVQLWKQLLADPPRIDDTLRLPEIARRAVVALDWPAPIGPAEPWEFARWAAEIVTAAERQKSPFLDPTGRLIPWQSTLLTQNNRERPFTFENAPRGAVRRPVDGELRLALVRSLVDRHSGDQSASSEESDLRAIWLADVAILLPNRPENVQGELSTLIRCQEARRDVYAALERVRRSGPPAGRLVRILRAMMRLHVAGCSAPRSGPRFDQMIQEIRRATPANDPLQVELGDVLDEMTRLEEQIGQSPANDADRDRASVDRRLKALLPDGWSQPKTDEPLYNRTFHSRLQALNGERVANLLSLEADLSRLLSRGGPAKSTDPDSAAVDLRLLERAFSLIDYTIWFSRPSFDPSEYWKPQDGKRGVWQPALVVLAWGDPAIQHRALDLVDRLGPGDALLAATIRRAIYQRNEAAMATIAAIVRGADPQGLLSFSYTHESRILDLRLLAENRRSHELSADALVRGAFEGVLMNRAIADAVAGPSDKAVYVRIFGVLDGESSQDLPGQLMARPLSGMSDDSVALLAARCQHDDRLLAALRQGAKRFLEEGHRNLLAGAETPDGVLKVAEKILTRVAHENLEDYRKFYEDELTESATGDESRLSRRFCDALAAPFFSKGPDRQKTYFSNMIEIWRAAARAKTEEKASESRLGRALRHGLGPLAVELAKGSHNPTRRPYLWQPVDQLHQERDVRQSPPAAFFDLVAWWRTLARDDDPEPIRLLLRTAGAEKDALAVTYRLRCERETTCRTGRLGQYDQALRIAVPSELDRSTWKAVETAWAQVAEVKHEYESLLDCPRKYNRWVKDDGRALGLTVPERVPTYKWEALRPILVLMAPDRSASGWDDPTHDSADWLAKGGAAGYEFLLLLRSLSLPGLAPADRDWIRRATGGDGVFDWTRSAESRAILAATQVLRGEYAFRLFPPGPRPEASSRITRVVDRLVWPAVPDARGDFPSFVAAKDAFLCDLLELIAVTGTTGPAIDWFEFGARSFPPFTILQPEPGTLLPGTVRVVLDRPGSRVKRLLDRLESTGETGTYTRLRDAVYWYQIDVLGGDGRLEPPAAGWSTWTRSNHSQREVNRPAIAAVAPIHNESTVQPGGPTVPENAWRRIIDLVIEDLRNAQFASDGEPLLLGIDQPAGWTLALGMDELLEATSRALGREVRAARGGEGIRVAVTRVKPGESIETVVRLGATELGPRRTIALPGLLPPWFAARSVAEWSDASSWLDLVVVGLGAVGFVWRWRRTWYDHVRGSGPRVWGLIVVVAGLMLALTSFVCGPVPRAGPRRGGVVDILAAGGPDLSPSARRFLVQGCVGVFRALAADASPSPLDAGLGWFDRWCTVARAVVRFVPGPSLAKSQEGPSIGGLQYRLVPLDGSRSSSLEEEGPISPGEAAVARFRARVEHLAETFKEPGDAPLPPAVPGSMYRVAFRTGDHGGLTPLPAAASPVPEVDVSVWLPGPTRDANADRGLTVHGRLLRIAADSRSVVAPVFVRGEPKVTPLAATRQSFADGSPIEDLDTYGFFPHDSATVSRRLWGDASAWADEFGRDLGLFCARQFTAALATSRSTLCSPASEPSWMVVLVLALIPVCALAQLQRPGFTSSSWRRFGCRLGLELAVQMLAVGGVAVVLIALYAIVSPCVWIYGDAIVALRLGIASAAVVAALPTVSMALAFVASRLWPLDQAPPALGVGKQSWLVGGLRILKQMLGLLLLSGAVACFLAIAVRDEASASFRLLPPAPIMASVIGLGLWLLAAACLLPSPSREQRASRHETSW